MNFFFFKSHKSNWHSKRGETICLVGIMPYILNVNRDDASKYIQVLFSWHNADPLKVFMQFYH